MKPWERWRDARRVTPVPAGSEPDVEPEAELESLEAFELASPELLASRALLRRVDTKFVLPRAAAVGLLEALRGDFRVVPSGQGRLAHYRTLYFDLPGRTFYRQHLRGRRERHKVRIRQYLERDLSFLELKTKDKYELTSKLRRPHPVGDFELGPEDRAFLAERLGESAHRLEPAGWLEFPRVTLLGTESVERLTLDLGLTVYREGERLEIPELAICELKQPRFGPRTPGMRAIRGQRIRPRGFSKYCAAVSLTGEDPRAYRTASRVREIMRSHHAR